MVVRVVVKRPGLVVAAEGVDRLGARPRGEDAVNVVGLPFRLIKGEGKRWLWLVAWLVGCWSVGGIKEADGVRANKHHHHHRRPPLYTHT